LTIIYTVNYICYRVAPTYESATSRMFYHGRTETTRSCTNQTKEWCEAMFNPNKSVNHF